MNQQRRFEICCHEAGHAVVSHVLNARRVESLHVFDTGGFCILNFPPGGPGDAMSKRDQIENEIIFIQAGDQAKSKAQFVQWTITGPAPSKINSLAPTDAKARETNFQRIVTGGDTDIKPDAVEEQRLAKAIYPDSFHQYLYWLACRSRALVENQWPLIQQVAIHLFHQGHVSRNEFLTIIERKSKCAQ